MLLPRMLAPAKSRAGGAPFETRVDWPPHPRRVFVLAARLGDHQSHPSSPIPRLRTNSITFCTGAAYLKVRNAAIDDQGCSVICFRATNFHIFGITVTSEPIGASNTA
jgi:hypothetical protein